MYLRVFLITTLSILSIPVCADPVTDLDSVGKIYQAERDANVKVEGRRMSVPKGSLLLVEGVAADHEAAVTFGTLQTPDGNCFEVTVWNFQNNYFPFALSKEKSHEFHCADKSVPMAMLDGPLKSIKI